MIDWSWLGGFWDGEGTITFGTRRNYDRTGERSGAEYYVNPFVCVGNSDIDLLSKARAFIEQQLETPCYWWVYPPARKRRAHGKLMVPPAKLLDFLPKLYPHLHSTHKRRAARVLWIGQFLRQLAFHRSDKRDINHLMEKMIRVELNWNPDFRTTKNKKELNAVGKYLADSDAITYKQLKEKWSEKKVA